ncbi:MAG: hypothetical protein L6V81_05865 [Clostridium sp.]|nr:MAG: hypothetical protein L6V81_05865 [Clostridium sp.]
MKKNEDVADYLSTIISSEVEVHSVNDIHSAFQQDLNNDFKNNNEMGDLI